LSGTTARLTYRINIAIDEYQEIEGELPLRRHGRAVVGFPWGLREDFDSPEAEAAVADVNEFALQTLLVTRETVMR
jgi:hypothetical protein